MVHFIEIKLIVNLIQVQNPYTKGQKYFLNIVRPHNMLSYAMRATQEGYRLSHKHGIHRATRPGVSLPPRRIQPSVMDKFRSKIK
jgi:hypothetical protein